MHNMYLKYIDAKGGDIDKVSISKLESQKSKSKLTQKLGFGEIKIRNGGIDIPEIVIPVKF